MTTDTLRYILTNYINTINDYKSDQPLQFLTDLEEIDSRFKDHNSDNVLQEDLIPIDVECIYDLVNNTVADTIGKVMTHRGFIPDSYTAISSEVREQLRKIRGYETIPTRILNNIIADQYEIWIDTYQYRPGPDSTYDITSPDRLLNADGTYRTSKDVIIEKLWTAMSEPTKKKLDLQDREMDIILGIINKERKVTID